MEKIDRENYYKSGLSLRLASAEIKNDKEIVLSDVKGYGYSLQYASDQLKNDIDVVLAAVKVDGYALKFASEELKNNKDVVLAAVKKHTSAFQFASDELKLEIGKNDPVSYLQAELPKQDDFRAKIENISLEELHARVQEMNKSVEIPDSYITEMIRPKEEVKSHSQVEIINHQPVVAQQPIKQRRLKL